LLKSRLCTQEQFETVEYREWCARIGEAPRLHRKQWEYCYIAQALFERGLLAAPRRGLGFGVGQEPLPALFAKYGCTVVATDVDRTSAQLAGWVDTGQHAESLAALNTRRLCDPIGFRRLVSYRTVDMNAISSDLTNFDFVWSSCAFEHLGSLERGMQFVHQAMKCLRPGGLAVHTTELNLSSDSDTLTAGGTVLYRKQDIKALAKQLTTQGHMIELDFDPGCRPADHYIDVPPYKSEPHLRLQIDRYVSTSIGLIIQKAGPNVQIGGGR
jgi:2-polyprenyl-3-methyl-5-hydroxy-6-metoxy-1,4-benzoquinol methylase